MYAILTITVIVTVINRVNVRSANHMTQTRSSNFLQNSSKLIIHTSLDTFTHDVT